MKHRNPTLDTMVRVNTVTGEVWVEEPQWTSRSRGYSLSRMNRELDSDVPSIRSTSTMKGGLKGLYRKKERQPIKQVSHFGFVKEEIMECLEGKFLVEVNKGKLIAAKVIEEVLKAEEGEEFYVMNHCGDKEDIVERKECEMEGKKEYVKIRVRGKVELVEKKMLKELVRGVEEERNEVRIEGYEGEWLVFALEEMEVVMVGEECVRVKKEEKIIEDVKEEESCDENVSNISRASVKSKASKCLSQQQQQEEQEKKVQHHKYYISRAVYLMSD